jgi:hypothetical protein
MLFRTFSNLGPFLLFIENLVELLVLVNSLLAAIRGACLMSLTLFIFYRVIFFLVSRLPRISALASGAAIFEAASAIISARIAVAASPTLVTSSVAPLSAPATTASASVLATTFISLALIFGRGVLLLVGIECLIRIDVESVLTKLFDIVFVLVPATSASSDLLGLL